MKHEKKIRLKVCGDYACFTRPDLKVERFSYPCMTPSAARGILSAILWKPQFKWCIEKIEVLKPIIYMNVKRNEIKNRQSGNPLYIEEVHTPRNSIILKDVAYVIEASIYQETMDVKNPPKKYYEMFIRRASKGQCYRQPYFGQREYSLDFCLAADSDKALDNITMPVGSMFFDMIYNNKGIPSPMYFYNVAIQNGVLGCLDEDNFSIDSQWSKCNIALMKSCDILPTRDENTKLRIAHMYERGVVEENDVAKEIGL